MSDFFGEVFEDAHLVIITVMFNFIIVCPTKIVRSLLRILS